MSKRHHILYVLATGFIVVTLWALLGFSGRWICWNALAELAAGSNQRVTVSPLRLLPDEVEYDPNVTIHSRVDLNLRESVPHIAHLGIVHDLSRIATWRGWQRDLEILDWSKRADGSWTYLDRARGQIVHAYVEGVLAGSQRGPVERKWVCIGPQGSGQPGSEAVGRFHDPVIGYTFKGHVVYDAKLRRFFRISLSEPPKVVEGPVVDYPGDYCPILIEDIERGCKDQWYCCVFFVMGA